MMSPEERYHRDLVFHELVDRLQQSIELAKYTPTELREAVILAATMYEMRNPLPRRWLEQDEIDALRARAPMDAAIREFGGWPRE